MLSAVRSAAVDGIEAYDVTVEVDTAHGLPHFAIVGLAAGAVKESRERVSAALVNSGFTLPPRRITVNLAPADVRKEGTAYDLPIALAVLLSSGQIKAADFDFAGSVFMGELGLDGSLRPVRGVISVARKLRKSSLFVVPPANASEAFLARTADVCAPANLHELVRQFRQKNFQKAPVTLCNEAPEHADVDFAEVNGQHAAKRALEIAAAGGHAVLMVGPPGAGKTMLARRLATILPSLAEEEALEVLSIHSVAGLCTDGVATLPRRPFRAPHHTVSTAGLVGGGSGPRPGEVSLAHHGVLFLDELLEFPRHVLDGLRQPLEDGRVLISRARGSVTFPARFSLVGAMNPCLCGLSGTSRSSECSCSPFSIRQYRSRLSGPLRDRIDLTVNVAAVAVSDLSTAGAAGEASALIRERVERARCRQLARFAGANGVRCNSQASSSWVQSAATIMPDARKLLMQSVERLNLSARGYYRLLKVALTISDLTECDAITKESVAEALRYR